MPLTVPAPLQQLGAGLRSVVQTWGFVLNHPLNERRRLPALARYVAWQIGSRLVPGPVAVPFVNDARLLVRKGMAGATGNIYTGLHELGQMGFVLHVLRAGDLFVDIGANVGAYTVLAGAAVGCRCMCFEPVPTTFQALLDNVRLNDLTQTVTCVNAAIGRAPGSLHMTTQLDSMNHVVVSDADGVVTVPVQDLDGVGLGDMPRILKIDVEGYEAEVLAGGVNVFSSPHTLAVLIELNGSGARYGFDDAVLHKQMGTWGYIAVSYDPVSRFLSELPSEDTPHDTIVYIRDRAAIDERIASAQRFRVHGVTL